jgi:type IV pilus assembly protein PilY1
VTDGLPTLDLAGKSWPPLGSDAALGYGLTATFNGDGSLNTTNSQALTDAIAQIAAAKAVGTQVYVLGLGAGVDPTINPTAAATLTAMAVAGGTNNYFAATSAADVTQDMQVILAKILAETAATSSASVNSTGLNTTSVAYQGIFTTSDTDQDWTGNLVAFPINPQTGYINTAVTAELWSAQTQLDAQSYIAPGRLIATWDPVAGAGTPFEWNPNVTVNGISPSTVLGQDLQAYLPDPSGQDVLNYLRGDNALELLDGGTFRNRTHLLGDIVDSAPLYVAGAAGPWQQISYMNFIAANTARTPVIYIGANDGMLHAFSAATGNELFAYIPGGVYSNLIKLVTPYYNESHLFYVDGSPQAADVQFASDSSWHTVLFGGEAAGGKSIYALDVTNPSNITSEANLAQAVLWEFSDGANMGLTYSPPVAVKTAAGFAIMFGNGYDSAVSVPILYALNPQTGAVMARIELCATVAGVCNGALANGLSGVVAANSHGLLGANADVLYAGDLQGNMWRVNISDPNPANWTVSVLFQARDPGGNRQPITTTPVVSLNPLVPALNGMMVYFGTGQYLGIPDLTNVQVQTVYGVFDSGAAAALPLLRANLQQQTMTSTAVTNLAGFSTTIRQLSSNPVNLPAVKGWYVDLNLVSGERVVTDPTLFNGTLQVTTFQPNGSTCTGGGNAWYMVFNYATGGATVEQQFDWNFQNTVNNNDLYMGQTVAGVSLGTAYAAGPKMVTGAGGAMVYTTSGSGEITQGPNAGTCTSIGGTSSCIPNWANIDTQSHGAWTEVR